MHVHAVEDRRDLKQLRHAVLRELARMTGPLARPRVEPLLSEALGVRPQGGPGESPSPNGSTDRGDRAQAWSSAADESERTRIIALVELARSGDSEAFRQLYDHYNGSVHRFLYYRLGSPSLAEDLTSETFFRALRSMTSFRWQGKDFGAWLMTIARNLAMDHFKSARTRLESATDDLSPYVGEVDGPERAVLDRLTNQALIAALRQLPDVQQECVVLRFLHGMSLAETAAVLGKTEGAVKQLQLRAVRNLAKLLPEEER